MNKEIARFPAITNLYEENIQDYPSKSFPGTIHVVDSEDKIKAACKYLAQCELIGFDTETKPSFKKGVSHSISLLQLSDDKHAFLFRLQKTGFPSELITILKSKSILKIGAAIHDDIKYLKKIRRFTPENFIDIQSIAKELSIEQVGLKNLCPIVLGFRISKRQQLSNWEQAELTEAQQMYAATDAWVCHQLYLELKQYIKP